MEKSTAGTENTLTCATTAVTENRKTQSVSTFLAPLARVGLHTRARELGGGFCYAGGAVEAGVWTANICSGERDKGHSGERPGVGAESESDPLTDVQVVKQPVAEIKLGYGGVGDFVIIVINVFGGRESSLNNGEEQEVTKNDKIGSRYWKEAEEKSKASQRPTSWTESFSIRLG